MLQISKNLILIYYNWGMWKVIVTVKDIDWNMHTLDMDGNEEKSIIDVAEDNWIDLPYSCRSGACFSCCAEVKKWKEHLDTQKTGEALIDVEENECLTCICWVKKEVFSSWEQVDIEIEMLN